MTNNFSAATEFSTKDTYLPPNWLDIKFSLYLVGEGLSIPCYLFVFYHLLAKKAARTTLCNHSPLVVLIFSFINLIIDLPLQMSYYRRGFYLPFNPAICLVHRLVDYGMWYGAIIAMLWLSFERHLLIFHSNLVRTARGRLVFHYAPVIYFCLLFLRPCEQKYNAYIFLCGGPFDKCPLSSALSWYLVIAHDIVPVPLIVILSGNLLVRVIVQKRRLQHGNSWRQNRKMMMQFMFLSVVYIIFILPFAIVRLLITVGITNFNTNVSFFLFNMTNVLSIVISYAMAVSLPNLRQKLRTLVCQKPTEENVFILTYRARP
ncbi:unnamed protein product [Adineta ricciae]|uniref:G-protein coupled receptors family 1 profile domain-containing protein n=1 Tax=Adineta ricciae TaxID=249248 RepID=A0A815B3J6_ADIRI|nr:unnamed protein product [Adineta ricciae]CAF1289770.1 unnamed protein product [Adineta ricciae]